jgi:membrane fusion protein (multidrug efflux system)
MDRTLDGLVNADVRAQVTGYLLRQDYQEGAFVRKGQLLFSNRPASVSSRSRPSRGQLAQAKAMLANAQAVQGRTQLDVNRYSLSRASRPPANRISITPYKIILPPLLP